MPNSLLSPTIVKLWHAIGLLLKRLVRIFSGNIGGYSHLTFLWIVAYQDSYDTFLETSTREIEALQD